MNKLMDRIKRGQYNILCEMTDYIVDEINYAVVTEMDAVWNEEDEIMNMRLKFSRGTRSYDLVFDWTGTISYNSDKMPKHMIVDIHNAICGGYLNGILNEMQENNK